MNDQTRLTRLIHEAAKQAVPDDIDLWPAIHARLASRRSSQAVHAHAGLLTAAIAALIVIVFAALLTLFPDRHPHQPAIFSAKLDRNSTATPMLPSPQPPTVSQSWTALSDATATPLPPTLSESWITITDGTATPFPPTVVPPYDLTPSPFLYTQSPSDIDPGFIRPPGEIDPGFVQTMPPLSATPTYIMPPTAPAPMLPHQIDLPPGTIGFSLPANGYVVQAADIPLTIGQPVDVYLYQRTGRTDLGTDTLGGPVTLDMLDHLTLENADAVFEPVVNGAQVVSAGPYLAPFDSSTTTLQWATSPPEDGAVTLAIDARRMQSLAVLKWAVEKHIPLIVVPSGTEMPTSAYSFTSTPTPVPSPTPEPSVVLPNDRVAVSIVPERLPFGLQAGDRVDVYMNALVVDTGDNSQPVAILPLDPLSEEQVSQAVEQRMIENVQVVNVALFPAAPGGQVESGQPVITLTASLQQAAILAWAVDAGVPIELRAYTPTADVSIWVDRAGFYAQGLQAGDRVTVNFTLDDGPMTIDDAQIVGVGLLGPSYASAPATPHPEESVDLLVMLRVPSDVAVKLQYASDTGRTIDVIASQNR